MGSVGCRIGRMDRYGYPYCGCVHSQISIYNAHSRAEFSGNEYGSLCSDWMVGDVGPFCSGPLAAKRLCRRPPSIIFISVTVTNAERLRTQYPGMDERLNGQGKCGKTHLFHHFTSISHRKLANSIGMECVGCSKTGRICYHFDGTQCGGAILELIGQHVSHNVWSHIQCFPEMCVCVEHKPI